MDLGGIIFVALGLSMDAFAVSVCKGLNIKKLSIRYILVIASFFGFFQGFMPLVGWLLGIQFEHFIDPIDHWIIFIILGFIGIKMIYESSKEKNELSKDVFNIKELISLAIATSIDALAVGITFSFLHINICLAVFLIAIITFLLCFLGVIIGNKFGSKLKNNAEIVGGIILILIGIKILLEHLDILYI